MCVSATLGLCVFQESVRLKKEGSSECNRTPVASVVSGVLAFCLLSVVFWVLPPPQPLLLLLLLPSPLSVALLPDEFVSLSGFSQTLRHLLPTDTQTRTDSITAAESEGGRRDRCTDRQTEFRQRGDGYRKRVNHNGSVPQKLSCWFTVPDFQSTVSGLLLWIVASTKKLIPSFQAS